MEILGISWRVTPGLTVTVFATEIGRVAASIGISLAMRVAVNDLLTGHVTSAVVTAAIAALSCTAALVFSRLNGLVGLFLAVEKAGTVLEDRMLRDIASLDTIQHLERGDYLDRITVLAGATGHIVGGMWTAVRSCFTVVQLAL